MFVITWLHVRFSFQSMPFHIHSTQGSLMLLWLSCHVVPTCTAQGTTESEGLSTVLNDAFLGVQEVKYKTESGMAEK